MKKGFKKLLNTIKMNWRIAVVVIVLMTISGYILSAYGLKKHYVCETSFYVDSLDNVPPAEKTSTASLLFSSPKMYDAINERIETRFSYVELGKIITIEQKNGSQVINAEFDCDTADSAYKLASIYVEVAQRVLDEYDAKAELTIISDPTEPQKPVFPNDALFTMWGAIAGTIISLTGILIIWRLDNTITAVDNLTEEYGIPVLGELMDFDREIDYLGR